MITPGTLILVALGIGLIVFLIDTLTSERRR